MIVGITQRVDKIESYNEIRDALDQRLVDWILKAGFIPVLIPNRLANLNNLEIEQSIIFKWLKIMRIDVILLSGGNDIGKEPQRDLLERSLLYWAEKKKKPVLGICRGMQMMGVYFGSKLIDVKGHVGTKHKLRMNSMNRNIYPTEVNSFHNQAIKDCPNEFKVIAKANDGNIEAIIHKKLPWEGWMWHPERENKFNSYSIDRIKQLFNV